MYQPAVWSRPFEDDEFDDLTLDDQYVELASDIREYADDEEDDELSELERREIAIPLAPPPPSLPVLRPRPVDEAKFLFEPDPPLPPSMVLAPGQLPPRRKPVPPSPPVKPASKKGAPAKKTSAKKAENPTKKASSPAKKAVSPAKKAVPVLSPPAKSAPPAKNAPPAKKAVPAKKAPAKNVPAKKR